MLIFELPSTMGISSYLLMADFVDPAGRYTPSHFLRSLPAMEWVLTSTPKLLTVGLNVRACETNQVKRLIAWTRYLPRVQ